MFYKTIVPTKYSETSMIGVFKINNIEYKFIQFKNSTEYLRIQDCCFTSEIMGSLKCDCKDQLEYSLNFLSKNGGILIYTPFEGRGIGSVNKIKAYQLQNKGFNTFEANELLGFKKECRNYKYLDQLLIHHFKIKCTILLTNNPFKINYLNKLGIEVKSKRVIIKCNKHSKKYIEDKIKSGHIYE